MLGKEIGMNQKVMACQVPSAWLVEGIRPLAGNGDNSRVTVYFYGGKGGWWQCDSCGLFVDRQSSPCPHVRAVENYEEL